MAVKPEIPQEEIDLGTLFSQIGKMFNNFFNFFGNIFKGIYHYFIVLLLFIRKNIIILGITTLLGVGIGYFLDLNKVPTYKSELTVRTNYGSASLLYKKLEMINSLISKNDTKQISEILFIPVEKAEKLVNLMVEPVEKDKNTKLAYDKYMMDVDTTYTKGFELEDFVLRVSDTDLKYHKITILTKEPTELDITKGIENLLNTKYYLELQKERIEAQNTERRLLEKSFNQFDSIRKRYKEVAYIQANKKASNSSAVNVTSGQGVSRNYDTELYHFSFMTLDRFHQFTNRTLDNEEIISVTIPTTFSGQTGGFLNQMWIRLGLLGFILSFLALIGVQFNKYLNRYEKNVG